MADEILAKAMPAHQPAGREEPTPRRLVVLSNNEVGGGHKGDEVVMVLTNAQLEALKEAGHVKDAPPKEVVVESGPEMVVKLQRNQQEDAKTAPPVDVKKKGETNG